MSEFIEKERVIEEINNLREDIPIPGIHAIQPWQDGYACALSDVYSVVSNIKSSWTSVKDGLPDKHTTVLICVGSGLVVTAFYDAYYGVFRLTEDDNLCYIKDKVSHWMYVPKAPEVNDSEVE